MRAGAGPRGRLLLVPNTLDLGADPEALGRVLPHEVLVQAARLQHWVVEDAKSARALLKRVAAVQPLAGPLQSLVMVEMPRAHSKASSTAAAGSRDPLPWLDPIRSAWSAGHDVGLMSEAGLPAVADPGHAVVAMAHREGVAVWPLSGPSSLMLALAASGLNGQSFAFVGYLPQDAGARAARLRELHQRSQREQQTQLLIETPYRNAAVMQALVQHLPPSTRLAVACGLTLERGWCRTLRVDQWTSALPEFDKGLPAVFSFLA